jgi:hypothetical protein
MSVGGNALRDNGLGNWMVVIPGLGVAGVFVVLIYASQLPGSVRWGAFGTALAIAAASGLVGGLLGFLFGIPRTVQGTGASTSGPQYDANTNLEQVSDWLTKILVGVGLVQIGRALPALGKLAEGMKSTRWSIVQRCVWIGLDHLLCVAWLPLPLSVESRAPAAGASVVDNDPEGA